MDLKDLKPTDSLFTLKRALQINHVTDLESIADYLTKLHDIKLEHKLFQFNDICLENGSDTQVDIILPDGSKTNCILWCINHYLGLNRHPDVIKRAQEALSKFGTGSGTSAMSGGISSLHKILAEKIAQMVEKETAILYPTGYTANLGAITALSAGNDLILIDKECHASIVDGCRLSGKKFLVFKHNDPLDLQHELEEAANKYDNIFVVVESAYSMSGDLSPLDKFVALKEKYKFYLYVDEAHSFGFYGKNGKGYCYEMGVSQQVDFIMSTLSKATASIGGFIATDKKFEALLSYYANSYCFQASLPPADAAAILACLDIIEHHPELANRLHEQTHYFRERLKQAGFEVRNSQSPVIAIYIPSLEILNNFAKDLINNGVFSIPVTYPAVPEHESRFRFIMTASHTHEQIDYTLNVIEKLGRKYQLIK